MALTRRSCTKLLLGILISVTFLFFMYVPIRQPTPVHNRDTSKDVKGWEAAKSRNTSLYVRPREETVLMAGANVCPPPPILLYVMVCSAVANVEARRAIRATWGRDLPPATAVIFFLGRTENETLSGLLQEEQATYQDIVQEDFVGSYNNLTIASVMMLKFTLHRCSHVRYLVKADDDIYLNVNKLYDRVTSDEVPELAGMLIKEARVIRDPNEKWYTPFYLYSEEVYPPYLAGCAYVMSRRAAAILYNVSLQTPLLHHEDVFITGICARVAGLEPRRLAGVTNRFHRINICNAWHIAVHRISPAKLRQLWTPIDKHRCNGSLSTASLLGS